MKTNHARTFVAPTVHRHNWFGRKGVLKAETARGLRTRTTAALAAIRTGFVDPDATLWPLACEVSNPYNFD